MAGREVSDIRLHEVAHHEFQEFGIRLLSEGRFQGLIFTRSIAETIFLQNLMKAMRESNIDLDSTAQSLFAGADAPDKHKDANKFMTPLVQRLLGPLKELALQAKPDEAAQELLRRRQKTESMGIQLTPRKRPNEEAGEKPAEPPSKSAKRTDELPTCFSAPFKPFQSQPGGHTEPFVTQWMEKAAGKMGKAKAKQFFDHVNQLAKTFKQHDKSVLQKAAEKYGLDPNLAQKMAAKNLSNVIALAQVLAA